jgi:hypothetical protein
MARTPLLHGRGRAPGALLGGDAERTRAAPGFRVRRPATAGQPCDIGFHGSPKAITSGELLQVRRNTVRQV